MKFRLKIKIWNCIFHLLAFILLFLRRWISRLAQRKRIGPITQGSEDRNLHLLAFCHFFLQIPQTNSLTRQYTSHFTANLLPFFLQIPQTNSITRQYTSHSTHTLYITLWIHFIHATRLHHAIHTIYSIPRYTHTKLYPWNNSQQLIPTSLNPPPKELDLGFDSRMAHGE